MIEQWLQVCGIGEVELFFKMLQQKVFPVLAVGGGFFIEHLTEQTHHDFVGRLHVVVIHAAAQEKDRDIGKGRIAPFDLIFYSCNREGCARRKYDNVFAVQACKVFCRKDIPLTPPA